MTFVLFSKSTFGFCFLRYVAINNKFAKIKFVNLKVLSYVRMSGNWLLLGGFYSYMYVCMYVCMYVAILCNDT